jgi:hypothetical protein
MSKLFSEIDDSLLRARTCRHWRQPSLAAVGGIWKSRNAVGFSRPHSPAGSARLLVAHRSRAVVLVHLEDEPRHVLRVTVGQRHCCSDLVIHPHGDPHMIGRHPDRALLSLPVECLDIATDSNGGTGRILRHDGYGHVPTTFLRTAGGTPYGKRGTTRHAVGVSVRLAVSTPWAEHLAVAPLSDPARGGPGSFRPLPDAIAGLRRVRSEGTGDALSRMVWPVGNV